jgi:hypothetical protein
MTTSTSNHIDATQDNFADDEFSSPLIEMSEKDKLRAELSANNGYSSAPALFDLEGNLVAAKFIETRYGWAWALLEDDDPRGSFKGFFSPSKAQNDFVRRANDAKKGYYVGEVMAPSAVGELLRGSGLWGGQHTYPVIYRTDKGFSRDVKIVDNGK